VCYLRFLLVREDFAATGRRKGSWGVRPGEEHNPDMHESWADASIAAPGQTVKFRENPESKKIWGKRRRGSPSGIRHVKINAGKKRGTASEPCI